MNNLLQSLTSHRLKLCAPEVDIKRLLSAVKNERNHDTKLSDAFYDSLEGVLHDLRVVTIDNRDAEAFLKPVSKTDYPDYYDIIQTPMDLQTMLKKVKQKQYKSKREFADDLELIWSNCFTYNTGENHPLRLCATRLRSKADKLLRNITDKKDRNDPPIPATLTTYDGSAKSKPNGNVNGHKSRSRLHSTPPPNNFKSKVSALLKPGMSVASKLPLKNNAFADMPAIMRTASGMSTFMELDRLVDYGNISGDPGPSTLAYQNQYGNRVVNGSINGIDRLRGFAESVLDSDDDEFSAVYINGDVGEKRKLNYSVSQRPRKKARTHELLSEVSQDPVEMWWDITRSQALLANGVPTITYSSSKPPSLSKAPDNAEPLTKKKSKRRKRRDRPSDREPKSLLSLINSNIRTLKRVRRTHDKFLALNLGSSDEANSNGNGLVGPGPNVIDLPEPIVEEEEIDTQVDERPWRHRASGIEVGEQGADDCLHWMGMKILEHAGFQGTSKAALDVFTDVAAEYLFNIGRTIRFLCDKFSRTMSPEEIILHTLFESGITRVHELERYIKDDVERYGARLSELEKKLVGAYREVTAVEAIDDEALFGNEDEEDGELVMGNFADAFGEDFLGLRELGIAADFGLSSLTIPKKLLRSKNKGFRNSQDNDKPKEPPPPYPPPPPFVPIDSTKIDDQIGLLRPFYTQKINTIKANTQPITQHPTLAPPPSSLKLPWQLQSTPQKPPAAPTSPIILPDDPPNAARTKIGPLGQIVRPSASAIAAKEKKKAKGKEGQPAVAAGLPYITTTGGPVALEDASMSPQNTRAPSIASTTAAGTAGPAADSTKKKKAAAPKKKDKAEKSNKSDGVLAPPQVIAASA